MVAVERLGLVSVDVEVTSSLDELCDLCLNLLWQHPLNAPNNALHRTQGNRAGEL